MCVDVEVIWCVLCTQIKDAFAVFKNLTLESRLALVKGGGLHSANEGNASGPSDQELLDQVKTPLFVTAQSPPAIQCL